MTSILPTTVTQMPEVLSAAVKNVADVAEGEYEGAEILGIHFEGPFLDMEYKGAQPPEAIAFPAWSSLRSTRRPPEAISAILLWLRSTIRDWP